MRFFTARRLALAALFPALLLVCVIPGCSNESEGERCTDDSDCSSGLTCTDSAMLLNSGGVKRCCNKDAVNDPRCVIGTSITSSGGGTGGSGTAQPDASDSAAAGAGGS